MEEKPARLTVLIAADRKKAFEELCASQDITPSQVVRRLIREFMEGNDAAPGGQAPARKAVASRKGR